MAKKRLLDLYFPAKGLHRRFAYQHSEPYSTPDCLNVRPVDAILERDRGGSRPGVGLSHSTELGSGNPVRLLDSVTWIASDGYRVDVDTFQGTSLGSNWEAIGSYSKPPVDDDLVGLSYQSEGRVAHTAYTDFDSSSAYTIETFIVPYLGEHWGTYSLYGMMDSTSPDPENNGFVAELTMTGSDGSASVTLTKYSSGSSTSVASGSGSGTYPAAGWFTAHVNGTTVTIWWNGEQICSGTISGLTGTRVGFGIECTEEGGLCLVRSFRSKHYVTTVSQARRNVLVASSNGNLYKEGLNAEFTQISTALTLESDRTLNAAERTQKLYIADNSDIKASGSDGTVSGTSFDAASYADWTAIGINANDYMVYIYNGAGGTTDGMYEISSIAAGDITLASAPGDGTCSYKIERCPKIYDPATDTLTRWVATSGKGMVPSGCDLICLYRDRLVLAGDYVWYMSRQADPLDWDYSQTDAGRAVAGQSSDAGIIGEPLTALIPHSDDYLVFGGLNSLWVLRGDAAWSGMLDNLSYNIGIVGKNAWTKGPNGEILFLSRDGIYALAPGAQSYPQSISRDVLPLELRDLTSDDYEVSLEYDIRFRGIHIYVTKKDGASPYHWWFYFPTQTFWPMSLSNDRDPFVTHAYYSADEGESMVLMGCRDGYVRRYDKAFETDEGDEISSHVVYGPVNLSGDNYHEGVVTELIGAVAEESGDVTWEVLSGVTNEDVVDNSASDSGTWSYDGTSTRKGLNYKSHPRVRGGSMCLKLSNGEERKWAIERVTAVMKMAGKQRLG